MVVGGQLDRMILEVFFNLLILQFTNLLTNSAVSPTLRSYVLVRSSNYYPFLVVQVGSDEVVGRSMMAFKKDFRALGWWVYGKHSDSVFLDLFSSRERYWEEKKDPSDQHVAKRLLPQEKLILFFIGVVYLAPACTQQMGFTLVNGRKEFWPRSYQSSKKGLQTKFEHKRR